MIGKAIDGKAHAAAIRAQVKERIANCKTPPHLAVILVGENPASMLYITNKKKACEEIGIKFSLYTLAKDVPEEVVLETVNKLNANNAIHGILTQQPFPKHICKENIVRAILPEKDVDCLHPFNLGLVAQGIPTFCPCTPSGVITLLKWEGVTISGKHAVIIGRSDIVGKPLAFMLLNENATVTICHSKTRNLAEICRYADILVAAAGQPKLVTANYVKDGAVVIDTGINRKNGVLCGDVDFESVISKAAYITPVPGGVGPMTIAILMENCVKAWELQTIGVKNKIQLVTNSNQLTSEDNNV